MVRSRFLMLGRHPWLSTLLVGETLTFVLLGALTWSAWRTMPALPTVLPEQEVTVFPRLDTVDNVPLSAEEVLRLVHSVPGVQYAAIGNQSPYSSGLSWASRTWTDDAPGNDTVVATYFGSEAMLQTLGLSLIEGRDFSAVDFSHYIGDQTRMHAQGAPAIVSASLAKRLYPETTALGRRLYIYDDAPLTIVGVVSALPVPTNGFAQNPDGLSILLPTVPTDARLGPLLVRSGAGDRNRVTLAVDRLLNSAYPRSLIDAPRALSADRVASLRAVNSERQQALSIAAVLSVLVLLVTVVISTYWMVRHHRMELSLRRALGASHRELVREWGMELGALAGLGAVLGGLISCSPIAFRFSGGVPLLPPLQTALLAMGSAAALVLMATGLARRAFRIPPHLVSRSPSVRL